MRRILISTFALCALSQLVFFQPLAKGFDLDAHEAMSRSAAQTSRVDNILTQQLGLSRGLADLVNGQSVEDWIARVGSREEDSPAVRVRHHFHDPMRPWDQAGLRVGGVQIGESSVLWGQNSEQTIGGKHSWHDARTSFFQALTATTDSERQRAYAGTFQSLGHLIHLIEDAASPAHTRNDAHLCCLLGVGDPDGFHEWAEVEDNLREILTLPSQPFDPSILTLSPNPLAPVLIARILDTEHYRQTGLPEAGLDIGLAEYSNANFFSDDTVFSSFPFPAASSVILGDPEPEPKTGELRRYFKKVRDGELVDHIAVPSALYEFLPDALKGRKKGLDDNVFRDYATKLLPRAVGYSAGLLNYFFRGTLSLSLPNQGIYGITNHDGSFNEIRINAQNITDGDEEMSDGEIHLVIKYKLALEDPMEAIDPPVSTSPEFLSEEFNYIVVPEANGARTIPRDTPVELIFDLSSNPLPIFATDVYFQVAYRGVLGEEADAVAVGFKDASEPTPVDVISSLDYVCLDGFFVKAGSLEAELFLDGRNLPFDFDFYAHRLNDVRIKFGPSGSFPDASLGSHNARFLTIEPAQFGRVFVLTEYTFSFGVSGNPGILDPRDDPDIVDFPFHDPFSYVFDNQVGVRHQTDLENQMRVYPLFEPFRGVKTFTGTVINTSLPGGDACSLETQSTVLPNLNGPVFTEIP